jgi:hypothetical protein
MGAAAVDAGDLKFKVGEFIILEGYKTAKKAAVIGIIIDARFDKYRCVATNDDSGWTVGDTYRIHDEQKSMNESWRSVTRMCEKDVEKMRLLISV